MCKKSKEIQQFNWGRDGDFSFFEGDDDVSEGIQVWLLADGWYPRKESFIWLPRQDQLQDMIVTLGMSSATFLQTMANKVWDSMQSCDYYLQFKSMEQLWLAFVMFDIWNKKWNGKDWR